MLERLEVRGLGIIERVALEVGPGLVALTGETGAGKSLLVESLKLLAGGRASADLVRTGESVLRVEAGFVPAPSGELAALLEELGVDAGPGEALTVRREVTAEGRSRAWVNDVAVTAGTLQRLAPALLAIHGQHEQYGLAEPAVQRRLVDDFGGHDGLLAEVGERFRRWQEASAAAGRLRDARSRRRDRLDAIAFQVAEIDAVAPESGEDDELRARRRALRHAVRLQELGAGLLGRLAEDETAAVDALAQAEREVEEMAELGLPLGDAAGRLREARVQVEEVVREARGLVEGIGEDPGELEAAESRLHQLESLTLKYGGPLAAVLAHRERLLEERAELEGVEERLGEAEAAAAAALAAYDEAALRLDAARRSAGEALTGAAEEVLERLNMGGTRLGFRWAERPEPGSPLVRDGRAVRFDGDGVAECELLMAPNPGEEPRPMARIASGGELSRLHLAIRTALRRRRGDAARTLLFDEVDSGLGGGTAAALGELLAELAASDQVLVVTHLPQVAARAGGHLRVDKVVEAGRTRTTVEVLDPDERVAEVARMLSGTEIAASALEHARALLAGP